ncbi:hypothetical protein H8A99_03235 [Bradyrhizobium sp. Arg68]|uniref:hypothetical protein n=1 Tax=Bradyrhizobium ivorense TaxID=2511166 RepID=UPI001E62E178|nr:hypothetical protein [Bradyrhizobium ivorense]MCC8935533.1 hypothetical protein [Bradyrhizobium ivorense]
MNQLARAASGRKHLASMIVSSSFCCIFCNTGRTKIRPAKAGMAATVAVMDANGAMMAKPFLG